MAGTVVVLFTDVVGSTDLLARLGDDAYDDMLRRHYEVVEHQIEAQGGHVVKRLGDGVMATFGGASDAVAAAVAVQRAVDGEARARSGELVSVRVGVSAGDATEEQGDWYGTPVVEGARLCAAASAGQIVVSEVVRLLAGTRGGHDYEPLGPLELKGLPGPVVASAVRWVAAPTVAAVPLPPPLAADRGELPFSGRSEVEEILMAAWKDAVTQGQRAVLISGEPGVGKTRLVAEFARHVHDEGAVVLLGRADEHVDVPFGVWREALRPLVQHGADEMLQRYAVEHGGELARLCPELARRVERLPAPIDADSETERILLFDAVGALLDLASADAPVLVVLDDVHWANRSSLLLLLHRLRSRSRAPVMVLATYRDTDVDRTHPLAAVLADLRREPCASRVALSGLDPDGVSEFLVNAGGHDLDDEGREFAAALYRDTEGNPFFVVEVLRHLIETNALVNEDGRWRAGATLDIAGLPEGVREVLGRRLAELPEATNRVLGAASVLGREFDVGLLAAVVDEPHAEVLDALEPALQAQLVREAPDAPGRYSFGHALVRAVLDEELGTNRRVRLHRAAGLALEARPDPPVGRLAFHFGEAAVMGETDRAIRYAAAAAEEALDLAAPDDAIVFVRRALDAAELAGTSRADRTGLQLLLGRALAFSGDYPQAREVVADAFTVAMDAGDLDAAYALAVEYGGPASVWEAFGEERGPAQLQRVLAALPPGDSAERVRALVRLGGWLIGSPGDQAERILRDAYEMAGRIGDGGKRAEAATALATALRNLDPRSIIALTDEALALDGVGGGGAPGSVWSAEYSRAEALLTLGDRAGVEADVRGAHARYEAAGIAYLDPIWSVWQAVRALLEGRFDEAVRLADEYDRTQVITLPRVGTALARTTAAYLEGDWAASADGYERAAATGPVLMAPYPDMYGAHAYGVAWTRATLARYRAEVEPLLPDWVHPPCVCLLAPMLRLVGDGDGARQLYDRYQQHSGQHFTNGLYWYGGPWDSAFAVLAMTFGDDAAAVRHAEAAVEQADAIGSPPHGAITRLELATALERRRAGGDVARAASVARESRRLAEALGMVGWVARLDALDAGRPDPWRAGVPD